MKSSRSYDSTLFVLGQVISLLFGFKIFYENFPNDMMWSLIGAALVIFGLFSLINYFNKKAE